MAFRSLHSLLIFWITCHTAAIQVTPGSPCSSQCMDSSTADESDPNASTTAAADIVCEDSDFTGTSTGSKWKQCMSCLQNSTYSPEGDESDQGWFLYNLRYSFDSCVFSYPDGTGTGTNPCETSTACGTLKTALEYGSLSAAGTDSDEFGYCDADGGSVTGPFYEACLNCVSASGDTNYIANALVALEAGCLQRPNTTDLLGLSGSVFSSSIIEIVDPSTLKQSSSTLQLSTGAIAGIAIGAVGIIAVVAAVIFISCRRRRNRSRIGGRPRWDKSHKRRSSFSFKCRNILASPLSPKFFRDLTPVEEHQTYGSLDAQMSGAPTNGPGGQGRYHIESKPRFQRHPYETSLDGWGAQDPIPQQTSVVPDRWNTYTFPEKKNSPGKGRITINTTEAALAPPPAAHQSPRANQFGIPPPATQHSPATGPAYTPVDHTTTSSPSQPNSRSPNKSKKTTMSSQGSGYPSLGSQNSSSPLLKQQHGWPGARENPEPWFPPPPSEGPPPPSSKFGRKVSPGNMRRGKRDSGSPVESKQIQVSFPAPPQR